MKAFFARVFAMHPLALTAALCLIAVTIPVYRWLDAERANVGAVPRAIDRQAEQTRRFLGVWLTANVMPPVNRMVTTVDGLPVMARGLIDSHATRIEDAAQAEIRHGVDVSAVAVNATLGVVERRSGEALKTVNDTAALLDKRAASVQGDVKPVLGNYAALAKNLSDSWDTLFDDVWGLVESATVASTQAAQTLQVVREKAPKFAGDVSGITADFHDATHSLDQKFFHPPPRTFVQKVKAFFGTVKDVLIAALRGGVL